MGAVGSRVSRAVSKLRARNERRVLLVGLDGAGKSSLVSFFRRRGAASGSTFTSPPGAASPTGGAGAGAGGGASLSSAPTAPASAAASSSSSSLSASSASASAAAAAPGRDFDIHTLHVRGKALQVWDVGGGEGARPYWRHYYTGTQGVAFVVDASRAGRGRLAAAADELAALAADEQLADAAIVVLANRCDAEGALTEAELRAQLGLARSLGGNGAGPAGATAAAAAGGGGGGGGAGPARAWRLVLCDTVSGKGLEEGLGFLADTMKEL